MPYGMAKDAGGDSPTNDLKMEHCVKKLMKANPDWDKSRAIATCKKSIQDAARKSR